MSRKSLVEVIIEPDYRTEGWRDSPFAPKNRGGRNSWFTAISGLIMLFVMAALFLTKSPVLAWMVATPVGLFVGFSGFVLLWIAIGLSLRAIAWRFVKPARKGIATLAVRSRNNRRDAALLYFSLLLGGIGGLSLYYVQPFKHYLGEFERLTNTPGMLMAPLLGIAIALFASSTVRGLLGPQRERSKPAVEQRYDEGQALESERRAADPADSTNSSVAHTREAREFEHEVARLFNILTTSKAVVVGGSGDGGIDIELRDRGVRVGIVQCKYYRPDGVIAPAHIRELHSAKVRTGVKLAYLITTARFSQQSYTEAKHLGIKLVDGHHLENMKKKAREELKNVRSTARG